MELIKKETLTQYVTLRGVKKRIRQRQAKVEKQDRLLRS